MSNWLKYILYFFLLVFCLAGGFFIYLYNVAIVKPPHITDRNSINLHPVQLDSDCYIIGNNWIRKSESGLWEMYVEGSDFERGVVNGKLSMELVHEQEVAFSEQINKLVPSGFYRSFLRYFIAWFNRDLHKNITEEYKREIYGVSLSASSEFDNIGPAYQRLMNYHAAHDIGHALQNLALVGCSSFGTWGDKSEDNKLIIGRNFDFYVGDRFAENKIVLFMKPDSGYRFMMVTWGGMIGVVSGMNMEGLTVTLNAAKSELPSGSATPVSLLAREILQYAKNIDEAVVIANRRKTFVSESFLIGSLNDNKAVNLEITPDTVVVFIPAGNSIVCTNHYESDVLGQSESNKLHMREGASVYRSKRIRQLLDSTLSNTPARTAEILRDQGGLNESFIGYGNEKAVNQLISHHSIIFDPLNKTVWVSTQPWQLGPYIAYQLDSVFANHPLDSNREVNVPSLTIPPDSFLYSNDFLNFSKFRSLKDRVINDEVVNAMELVDLNPEYYHSYVITGDYYFRKKEYTTALTLYNSALTKEIATVTEENYIIDQIKKCRAKMKQPS